MHSDLLIAFALFMAFVFYALTGGADYGAGVWNIFVPRNLAKRQKDLISLALQPIWEANHVWLILILVILFSAYAPVFAFICTTLNVPMSIALLGVVLRGISFVAMKYDPDNNAVQALWGTIFAGASIITPFIYGAMIGAISAGHLIMPTADIWGSLFAPWLSPYSICLGFFTLAIFAMLAASYLAVDAEGDEELQLSFRRRSLISHGVVAILGVVSVLFAGQEDVWVYKRIGTLPWALVCGGAFVACFLATVICTIQKRYKFARILAAGEGFIILLGYAVAQYPFLVPPDYTVVNSASPHSVLTWLVVALAVGAAVLFPSLLYLYMIFKGPGDHSTQAKPFH